MRQERGFAMADALVALMILSVLLTSLIGLNATSLSASQKSNARLTATLVAQAVLEDRSIRADRGEFRIDGRTYAWNRQVQNRPSEPSDIARIEDITITVEWQVKSGQNQTSLSSSRWRAING